MTDGSNEQVIAVPTMGPGHATELVVRVAQQHGFACVASGPATFRVARTYRPKWATITAIATALFVGLGLLFLLVKRTASGVVSVLEDREGTKVRLVGLAGSGLDTALRSAFTAAPATVGAGAPVGAGTASMPHAPAPSTASPSMAPPSMAPPAPPAPVVPLAPSSPTVVHSPVVNVPAPFDGGRVVVAGGPGAEPTDAERTIARPAAWRSPGSVAVAPHAPVLVRGDQLVTVGGGVVLGRDPRRDPAVPDAVPVRIDDPSVSGTHVTVGPTPTGVWVVDHHSTNGTEAVGAAGAQPCPGGVRVDLAFGSELRIGDVVFRVRGAA